MSIDRIQVSDFNSGVWRHYHSRNLPFVLELEPHSFPCLDWTAEKLAEIAGDEDYVLYEMPKDKPSATRNDMTIHKLKMDEICSILTGSNESNRYQMITDIKDDPSFFSQASVTTELFGEIHNKLVQCNLWLNLGEFSSGFHYDCLENLNLQISGTKRFVLYEPGLKNYYVKGILSAKGHTSHILDPDNYDESKYGKFAELKSRRHEVTLTAGQMLYLPICWWHNVLSEGDTNINVNYWWINTRKSVTKFPRQFVSGLVTVLYRKMTNRLY